MVQFQVNDVVQAQVNTKDARSEPLGALSKIFSRLSTLAFSLRVSTRTLFQKQFWPFRGLNGSAHINIFRKGLGPCPTPFASFAGRCEHPDGAIGVATPHQALPAIPRGLPRPDASHLRAYQPLWPFRSRPRPANQLRSGRRLTSGVDPRTGVTMSIPIVAPPVNTESCHFVFILALFRDNEQITSKAHSK